MKSCPDFAVHTSSSNHLRLQRTYARQTLQFRKMSDQEQLRQVRKPHCSDSVERYFCCNFSSYFSVKAYKISFQLTFNDGHVADLLKELGAYLEGHLGILDAVSIWLKADKRHLDYMQKRNCAEVEEALLKVCGLSRHMGGTWKRFAFRLNKHSFICLH